MLLAKSKKFRRTSYNTYFWAPPDLKRYTCSSICVICHESNEIGYVKMNVETNSGTAVSSFFYSQILYYSLVLGLTEEIKILRNLSLIITKRSVLRLRRNRKTFA